MQRALEEQMKELLKHANYQSVADAVGVTRTEVWRWAHGKHVHPAAVARVKAALRPDLPNAKEPPHPAWVERLLGGLIALESRAGVTDKELARAEAQAAVYLASLAQTPPRR